MRNDHAAARRPLPTYVEPGASATNDRRPEFQRMIGAGTSKPAPFDVVIVHSFSRFFGDHFELEFYVRKLAKNGVKPVSITQAMGDDPMHVMKFSAHSGTKVAEGMGPSELAMKRTRNHWFYWDSGATHETNSWV